MTTHYALLRNVRPEADSVPDGDGPGPTTRPTPDPVPSDLLAVDGSLSLAIGPAILPAHSGLALAEEVPCHA